MTGTTSEVPKFGLESYNREISFFYRLKDDLDGNDETAILQFSL